MIVFKNHLGPTFSQTITWACPHRWACSSPYSFPL